MSASSSLPSTKPRPEIPSSISTGCPELDLVWGCFAHSIVHDARIPIPDTEEDLNWHAFLGHGPDMSGFRAAEFVGVDALTKPNPMFIPLKTRGIGIPELASLWEVPAIRSHILDLDRDEALQGESLHVLANEGGTVGESLAEAFEHFPWAKFNWSLRALLKNSAELRNDDYSFRRWLERECKTLGVNVFPPPSFRKGVNYSGETLALETALRLRLKEAFFMVAMAMAAYMICDWALWLWWEGRVPVFASFKLDRYHQRFVNRFGGNVVPRDEVRFARWWNGLYPELPPRLANECIWLGIENRVVSC